MDSIQSQLQAACNDSGEVSYRTYSGRGMYGRNCVGITGSMQQCLAVISSVIQSLTQSLFDTAINCADDSKEEAAAYDENDQVQKLIGELLSFDKDSMGYDVVVYWPDMEFVEAESDLPTNEWIETRSEQELLLWVRDNREYHTDEDNVENHGALVATVKLMRDRMAEDHA